MSETIDTRCRVAFKVSADVFARLYEDAADADLSGNSMGNNELGSYVRQLLTDPSEANVDFGEDVSASRESSRTVACHVSEDHWDDLRETYSETPLADDPIGRNCKFGDRFGEFCRRVVVSRMSD